LIDAYVLVLMMVAFRLDLAIGKPGTESYAAFDILVSPYFGFYGFIFAGMVSLATSSILLDLHRRATRPHPIDNHHEKRALFSYPAATPISKKFMWYLFGGSTTSRILMAGGLVVTFILIAVGCYVDSFTFHFKGLAGFAVGLEGEADNSYSVISLSLAVPNSSKDPSDFRVHFIEVMFMCFVLIIPLLQVITLAYAWFVPMTIRVQRNWLHINEVVGAWAGLEVFVCAIIAALLEIRQFAKFMVASKCAPLDPLINKFGFDSCFDVETSLENGCWILFTAAALSIALGQIMIRQSEAVLLVREAELNKAAQIDQPVPQSAKFSV